MCGFRYDCVFNTAGELKNNLCKQLCSVCGIFIPIGPHCLPSDSYGAVRGFFYSLWLRFAYVRVLYNKLNSKINSSCKRLYNLFIFLVVKRQQMLGTL